MMTDHSDPEPAPDGPGRWRFGVDRGGTFTDIVAVDPSGRIHAEKLLSQSDRYEDAAIEGIRRFLDLPAGQPLPRERVAWIRLGTTVATNALLERTGAPVGLLITRGFRDLLEIGGQRRPELFALGVRRPRPLYQAVAEVSERMDAAGGVLTPLDAAELDAALGRLQAAGVAALAIVFLHAWKNPAHEEMAMAAARRFDFTHVSASHRTLSLIQVVGRGRTTLVDAYLTPVLWQYARRVRRWTGEIPLHFMGSSGALLVPEGFTGKDATVSGPAGGVLGVAAVAERTGEAAVIGFDMGGTSTDVCRYAGSLERILAVETAGIRYQAPMLHVRTVAAGGGSILHFDGQKLSVGPDSAGADPGPACYGLGGPAALTDANLLLGRIDPAFVPSLFGPERNAPLDVAAARSRLAALAERVAGGTGQAISVERLALGCIRIADEAMSRPIRELSVARGFDPGGHALVCFGGAGGQHACGIARGLGMPTVHLHPLGGVLSAFGIAMAPHRRSHVESLLWPLGADTLERAARRGAALARTLEAEMSREPGVGSDGGFERQLALDLRIPGADTPLTVPFQDSPAGLVDRFHREHRRQYGYEPPPGPLELVNLHVEVVGRGGIVAPDVDPAPVAGPVPEPVARRPVWFAESGPVPTPVYQRHTLPPGVAISGPALIVERHTTTVVEPGFSAEMGVGGVLTLRLGRPERGETAGTGLDPVHLELFNHRFMGIAERMGESLARTAHSVNMKERLDFSCALFDHRGRLVANAPHVPVHLGAMGETVVDLLRSRGAELREGDVYLSNDPHRGGSHLPDVTVMAPLFRRGRLAFFAAARGHHADMGGLSPGSMPPFARSLAEEGVVFANLLAVREGRFLQQEVTAALQNGPHPARNLPERLSDLRAQIAAVHRGLLELTELCVCHGDAVVAAYMGHMRENAARAMAQALEGLLQGRTVWRGRFSDRMDGGERIAVSLVIDRDDSGRPRVLVDFSGTAPFHGGNLNAPPAVTRAAVLYVLRTLIDGDIPLNDGCLEPVTLRIPADSLLNPPAGTAVAGGNVETSQRVVDVLYGALGVAAASQGTMNNFLFGAVDGRGGQYYETIAGGAGAVAGVDGASGVQVHMTNTRITDPEVLEYRFPQVRLEGFFLARGSGGGGRWRGGDGVVRRFRFLTPLSVTLLSQRRSTRPFGLAGGEPGAAGENRLWRAGAAQAERLPGCFQGRVEAGDLLEIRTPGGGGFGSPEA